MVALTLVECAFLIPVHRDEEISDGAAHGIKAWRWLREHLYEFFDGWTEAPGKYHGTWKSAKTRGMTQDESRRFIVAIPRHRIDELRDLLKHACHIFQQQCIYLSLGGIVEFVAP